MPRIRWQAQRGVFCGIGFFHQTTNTKCPASLRGFTFGRNAHPILVCGGFLKSAFGSFWPSFSAILSIAFGSPLAILRNAASKFASLSSAPISRAVSRNSSI